MEIKSVSECLNRIDNMIFDKSLKYLVKDDLELIRNHIEWQQAVVVAKGEYIQERLAVLSVLSQINHLIERFCSNDSERLLDMQYNKIRHKILEWYDTINTKSEKYFNFKEIRFNK